MVRTVLGGEVKEVEPVGVHDIAEELRERRAEPAVEEQGKEWISIWSHFPSGGWKYLRARVRSRLRRPEEVVVLPQLPRGELGGKTARSFRSAASRCASVDFTTFPFSAFGAMAEVVEEADGVGGAGGDGGGALLSFGFGKTRERRRFLRLEAATGECANCPCFPCL